MTNTLNGVIQFHIGAQCIAEMKTWSPSRIEQFFHGVAQIVRAAGENAKVELEPVPERDITQPGTLSLERIGDVGAILGS